MMSKKPEAPAPQPEQPVFQMGMQLQCGFNRETGMVVIGVATGPSIFQMQMAPADAEQFGMNVVKAAREGKGLVIAPSGLAIARVQG